MRQIAAILVALLMSIAGVVKTSAASSVNYTIGLVESKYITSISAVQYIMYDEDMTRGFSFVIKLPAGQEDVELGKTYTLDDMTHQYTYTFVNSMTYFTAVKFVKSLTNDGRVQLSISATTGTGASAVTYKLRYEEPIVLPPTGETIQVVITEPIEAEYYPYTKDFLIIAMNDDYEVWVDVFSEDSESVIGEYKSADGDFDFNYTYLRRKADNVKIHAVEAEAVIALDAQMMTLTATILGNDGIVYDVYASYDTSILTYDAREQDFDETFTGYTFNDEYFEEYGGMLNVSANNANRATVSIVFYSEMAVLQPGVYPISSTWEKGTAQASRGIVDGYVDPSFCGYRRVEDNYLDVPIWFMVEGTVTVKTDGTIIAQAVNSAGRTVRCVLRKQSTPTGCEGIESVTIAAKRIENGMLIIRANGKDCNAQGAVIR